MNMFGSIREILAFVWEFIEDSFTSGGTRLVIMNMRMEGYTDFEIEEFLKNSPCLDENEIYR